MGISKDFSTHKLYQVYFYESRLFLEVTLIDLRFYLDNDYYLRYKNQL